MARQRLGEKKERRIASIIGKEVLAAFTRGGRPHFWAEVYYACQAEPCPYPDLPTAIGTSGRRGHKVWVNYKTGEVAANYGEIP